MHAYSKLVLDCINLLNAASLSAPLTLQWVWAHIGVYGNEIADQLAKNGSQNLQIQGPDLFGPVSFMFIKGVLRTQSKDDWNDSWWANPAYRQT